MLQKYGLTGEKGSQALRDLAGKASSLDFSSLIYGVMSAPLRHAEYQQSIRDAMITLGIYQDLTINARHCAKSSTEITVFNLGSHAMRCLIITGCFRPLYRGVLSSTGITESAQGHTQEMADLGCEVISIWLQSSGVP